MHSLPEIKSKLPKEPFRKSSAVKQLESLADAKARQKYPSMPEQYLAPRRYRDDSANGLTKCIVDYIRFKGGFASRINSMGTYRTDLGRYVYGTSHRGLADVMATYQGKSLHIETKIGKDKQSESQRKIEKEVTMSGGLYFIAKDFETFKNWFDYL